MGGETGWTSIPPTANLRIESFKLACMYLEAKARCADVSPKSHPQPTSTTTYTNQPSNQPVYVQLRDTLTVADDIYRYLTSPDENRPVNSIL